MKPEACNERELSRGSSVPTKNNNFTVLKATTISRGPTVAMSSSAALKKMISPAEQATTS